MSIAAPASFTVTGGATITIVVTWSVNTAGSTFVVNSNTYKFTDVFDKPAALLTDLQAAGGANASLSVAMKLLQALQTIVSFYALKDNQSTQLPFSIAIA
jgi:hypothetical protein